jgi:ribonuclease J
MHIRIHRGARQIGGTCIEIESQGKRILLDLGLPLDAEPMDIDLPHASGLKEPDATLLGVFISHPHLDHYGLASKVRNEKVPIMIGEAANRIIQAANKFMPSQYNFKNLIQIRHKSPIVLGPFTLTPFLVDHSAYDSYALLIEADGMRVFYSGDFRGHGRKGTLFEKMLSKPPQNIDVLLMEGTTLGRLEDEEKYRTESELESQFIQLFHEAKGMALVWCSGQNIDRLVTVYRACRRSGKQLIADMYTASVLQAVENPNLPQPGFSDFRVFLHKSQKKRIIKDKEFAFAKSFRSWRIYPEDLKNAAGKSVMLFRPSMKTDLEEADCLDNATLIYSMWPGYLKQPQYHHFLDWLKEKAIPLRHCHTSGHAPLSDLKRFAQALNSRMLVPIHTFEPEQFQNHFKNVHLKNDGEWWEPVPDLKYKNLNIFKALLF